jgi:hypothetical protein
MQDLMHKMVGVKLIEDQEELTKRAGWYHRNKGHIEEAARALVKIEVQSASLQDGSVDFNVTGDKHTLKAVFGALRKLGYEPSKRPLEKPAASFYCSWYHPEHDCKFFLWFTSSKCTRVKVGTETKEVDIYETVCE